MLTAHPPPVVQADATALPFVAGVFDVAGAVNVLDHLPQPTVAIDQAHRVLVPRGILIAATTSRHDSPELAHVWRPRLPASTPRIRPGWWRPSSGRSRSSDGMRRWCGCPDRDTVRDYVIARFVAPEAAVAAPERVTTPVTITKRGSVIHARK
jgi:SAM-dependent methyltransferase